jgi:hypothetical protein
MARLILTTSDSGAGGLKIARIADAVIPFGYRFVRAPVLSDSELADSLRPLSSEQDPTSDHWLSRIYRKHLGESDSRTGFLDLCERFETIDLWIDPDPNAQLILMWLLDYLGPHPNVAARLSLVQPDVPIGNQAPEDVAAWRIPVVKMLSEHLELASSAWQAYRAPTPQAWFNLLSKDLSALPQLRSVVIELLEELPMRATGLGATQMRMLELISEGNIHPFDLFPHNPYRRRVFDYWETGSLLDGLAHCPAPAVAGLDEGPFAEEMHRDHSRFTQYKESRLSLTALGEAILARTDDFSRHNPISRWWGGTKLTNDSLWRWDPANRSLIAP